MKRAKTLQKLLSVLLSAVLLCSFAGLLQPASAAYANEQAVFDYLTKEMGLNTAAACGVLANIEKESGFNPNARGDGGSSYGLCQWHGARFTKLKNYCAANGLDYTTIPGQMAFLAYELDTGFPKTNSILRSVENTAEGAFTAGYNWCYRFEVPRGYNTGVSDKRGASARDKYWPVYHQAELDAAAAAEGEAVGLSAAAGVLPGRLILQVFGRVAALLRALFNVLEQQSA